MALDAGVIGLHIVKRGWIDDIRLALVLDVIAAGTVASLAPNVPLRDFLGVDIVIDRVAAIAADQRLSTKALPRPVMPLERERGPRVQ
jgi:hypothetical protein